jgi:hypothetical protein
LKLGFGAAGAGPAARGDHGKYSNLAYEKGPGVFSVSGLRL